MGGVILMEEKTYPMKEKTSIPPFPKKEKRKFWRENI